MLPTVIGPVGSLQPETTNRTHVAKCRAPAALLEMHSMHHYMSNKNSHKRLLKASVLHDQKSKSGNPEYLIDLRTSLK
jgi:hypothetical protein